MYEVFYSLRAEPFRLSPDHRFCYEHSGYAKARAYMAYALKRAEGFVMITGRPGTGKTTLIGELVESLADEDVITANLVCTQLQADDLLRTVAYSFEVGSSNVDKAELLQRITVMLNRWHREGRRALLVVDEAQDLSISAMEELRLLTNIQVGGQPLLQIFLLGQPELRDLILSPELEQVHQRIVAASHLEGLQEDEAEAYVIHRLLVVGWQGDPAIDRRIFPLIHKFSEGIPRRINLICSRLLLLGCVEERHEIGPDDVRIVIQELQAENLAAGSWHSEQEFTDSGEPDWVVLPGLNPEVAEDGPEPVQLRAVAGEAYTPQDTSEHQQDEVAKKKGLAPVAPPSPEPEAGPGFEQEDVAHDPPEAGSRDEPAADSIEPSVDGQLAEPGHSGEFERQDDSAAVAAVAAKPEAQIQDPVESLFLPPDDSQQNQGRRAATPASLSGTEFSPDRDEAPAAPPMPARVSGSRDAGRGVAPPRRASRFLIVLAIVLALGISLLFFFELYVGRDNGWSGSNSASSAMPEQGSVAPGDAEAPQEVEPPLPELAQLPSEKWEEEGQLIFMDEEEVMVVPVDVQETTAAALETPRDNPEVQLDSQSPEANISPVGTVTVPTELGVDPDAIDEGTADQSLTDGSVTDGGAIVPNAQSGQGDGVSLPSALENPAARTNYAVNFEFDSIFLDAKARATLTEVVQRMQQQASYKAVLTGFADYQGAEAYNLVLSRQRAEEVMQFLVGAGLSAGRLSVDGRGAQPQPESREAGALQQLRVVEIDLIDEAPQR